MTKPLRHFAIIGLVIVAAEVQQSVQNQLRHFFVECEAVFFRLSGGGFD